MCPGMLYIEFRGRIFLFAFPLGKEGNIDSFVARNSLNPGKDFITSA